MQDWTDIRRAVLVEGASKRSICRRYGIAHKTLEKVPRPQPAARLPPADAPSQDQAGTPWG